ncbi:MAG: sigma factor-like helix-turn-helix DNA-binding protein [Rhodospirillaceae bacterium]
MNKLDEREREIFIARRMSENQEILNSLSETFGLSPERIRQIENAAFAKVKGFVRNEALDDKLSHQAG